MPESRRRQLVASVMDELHAYIDAVDAFEVAVAGRFGIDRHDLRWFAALTDSDGMSVAGLQERSGLDAELLDATLRRLEADGHVVLPTEADAPVRASEDAARVLRETLAPIDAAASGLHRYGAEELGIVRNFLRVGRRFYEKQLDRFEHRPR